MERDTDGFDTTPELDIIKTLVEKNAAQVIWYPKSELDGIETYRVPKKLGHEHAQEASADAGGEG